MSLSPRPPFPPFLPRSPPPLALNTVDDLQQSRAAVLGELQKAVISPTFDEAKVASFFSPDVRYELRPASATVAMPGFPKDGFVPADKVPKWYKLVHDKFSQENNVRFAVPSLSDVPADLARTIGNGHASPRTFGRRPRRSPHLARTFFFPFPFPSFPC